MQAVNDDPNQNHTVWEWNYYYQLVRGIPGPDPTVVLPNNANADTELISLNEWWTGMTGAGFSGMGNIARGVNPYANPMGTPMGSYLTLLGSEAAIKVVN
jgi:hypothetical protein